MEIKNQCVRCRRRAAGRKSGLCVRCRPCGLAPAQAGREGRVARLEGLAALGLPLFGGPRLKERGD